MKDYYLHIRNHPHVIFLSAVLDLFCEFNHYLYSSVQNIHNAFCFPLFIVLPTILVTHQWATAAQRQNTSYRFSVILISHSPKYTIRIFNKDISNTLTYNDALSDINIKTHPPPFCILLQHSESCINLVHPYSNTYDTIIIQSQFKVNCTPPLFTSQLPQYCKEVFLYKGAKVFEGKIKALKLERNPAEKCS